MISKHDRSTDGKSSHPSAGSQGSVSPDRVGSTSLPTYPLVIVCLGLLNSILLLTAVVIGIYCGKIFEESSPHQIKTQALIMEVRQLHIMYNETIEAQAVAQQALDQELRSHQQLKLQLEQTKTLCDGLQMQLEALQAERATLQSNSSDFLQSCGRCLPGWFLLNTSCYYHARSASSLLKNWTESRADCISRGADLAVIDNWEEQVILYEYLPKVDRSIRPWSTGGVWIGLTDVQTEGTWVWVNNVTLLNEGYWTHGEPNNYGSEGEDCGAILNTGTPRGTWFDGNCEVSREWLCEREPN